VKETEMNFNKRSVLIALAAVLAVGLVAGGAAIAASGDEDEGVLIEAVPTTGQDVVEVEAEDDAVADPEDVPLTQREIDQASSAALDLAGGGTVTEVDRSDDLGEAFEVEVLTDRGEIDVALSSEFERVPNLRFDD
jgi:hypothetical protein